MFLEDILDHIKDQLKFNFMMKIKISGKLYQYN